MIEPRCGSKYGSRSVAGTKPNPVHLLYSIKRHWYSTGKLRPQHMETKAPLVQLYKPIELRNIDISQRSGNVMDNDQALQRQML